MKLIDFGLASRCDVDQYIFCRCGTPGFVAPEIINSTRGASRNQTTKCDVFSTGIIFFLLLTGKLPFEGKNPHEILKSNQMASIDFNIKELRFVPTNTKTLLQGMLEVDPELRLGA